MKAAAAFKLELDVLHPAQQRCIEERRRHNVLVSGRRFGKSTLGLHVLLYAALNGLPVAWFAPYYKQLTATWRELLRLLGPLITLRNADEYHIELSTGGSVDMYSLDNFNSVRSRGYALVVIDEAALCKDLREAWEESIRPTLVDYCGESWFLGTPKGIGSFFHSLYKRGQDPDYAAEWISWHFVSADNPHLNRREIEGAQHGSSSQSFAQEFLAEWVSGSDAVFRDVLAHVDSSLANAQPQPNHRYAMGLDWGRTTDASVVCVADIDERAIVYLDRFTGLGYGPQAARVAAAVQMWKPKQILAEQNGLGQGIIEQLRRDHGLKVTPFNTTNTSKNNLVEVLQCAFEHPAGIRILPNKHLISELLAFSSSKLPSGLVRYEAPRGEHDDCVIASMLAWAIVTDQGPRVSHLKGFWL